VLLLQPVEVHGEGQVRRRLVAVEVLAQRSNYR
jgi:hypothetical protein